MSARAIFLDDARREKRASLFHLAFWCAFLLAAVTAVCAFCLHIGDALGYQRATEEFAHKSATRTPPADVFQSFGARGCIEYGRSAYQQCRMAGTRKAG